MASKSPHPPAAGPSNNSDEYLMSPPSQPEPVHLRRDSHEERRPSSVTTVSDHPSSSEDEREATELRPVSSERQRLSRVLSPGKPPEHWYDPVKRYWRHEIRISVPHVDCRDHLGESMSHTQGRGKGRQGAVLRYPTPHLPPIPC